MGPLKAGLAALGLGLACSQSAALQLQAASSFGPALDALRHRLPQQGAKLDASLGSSGQILHRALAGAPYDLVILADREMALRIGQPRALGCAAMALVEAGARPAQGRHAGDPAAARRVALPNGRTAPSGRVALAWLATQPHLASLPRIEARNAAAALWVLHAGAAQLAMTPAPLARRAQELGRLAGASIRVLPEAQVGYWVLGLTRRGLGWLGANLPTVHAAMLASGYSTDCDRA